MSNSIRFNQLIKRISVIEKNYLPTIKASGNYSNKEQDDTRAYVLLVHAEIESYFEDIAEEKVKKAFQTWQVNRQKSNVLLSLMSFNCVEYKEQEVEKRINKALTSYIHSLRNNHGIKETNILNILLPAGFEYNDIDTTWLGTINSFGANRGAVAHSSAKVQQPLDPVILKSAVTQIIREMKNIDEKFKGIK